MFILFKMTSGASQTSPGICHSAAYSWFGSGTRRTRMGEGSGDLEVLDVWTLIGLGSHMLLELQSW